MQRARPVENCTWQHFSMGFHSITFSSLVCVHSECVAVWCCIDGSGEDGEHLPRNEKQREREGETERRGENGSKAKRKLESMRNCAFSSSNDIEKSSSKLCTANEEHRQRETSHSER